MERRRFLQMMTAAAVGGVVGTAPRWTSAAGRNRPAQRPRSGDLPDIVLVQNAWTASALNAAIAKILIEENLGNSVEITAIDENTMFSGLADGDLDACLELWPSGISADEQAYLDDGEVVEIGQLGVDRSDRLVRAPLRPGAVPGDGYVGGVPRSRARCPVRQPGDGRPRPLPRHRPVVLAVRRDDHREPRPAAAGRVLRVGGGHRGRPRLRRGRRGADPDVLVGAHRRCGEVRPRRRSSCPRTPTSAMPTRPRSPAPTPRTCSSRSPRRSSPRRTRR